MSNSFSFDLIELILLYNGHFFNSRKIRSGTRLLLFSISYVTRSIQNAIYLLVRELCFLYYIVSFYLSISIRRVLVSKLISKIGPCRKALNGRFAPARDSYDTRFSELLD